MKLSSKYNKLNEKKEEVKKAVAKDIAELMAHELNRRLKEDQE